MEQCLVDMHYRPLHLVLHKTNVATTYYRFVRVTNAFPLMNSVNTTACLARIGMRAAPRGRQTPPRAKASLQRMELAIVLGKVSINHWHLDLVFNSLNSTCDGVNEQPP